MSDEQLVYCDRCRRDVETVGPWPGFVWIKRAWYGGLAMLALLMPVIMSEITLLMPLAIAFGLAAGPVHMLAAQRRSCRECGAITDRRK